MYSCFERLGFVGTLASRLEGVLLPQVLQQVSDCHDYQPLGLAAFLDALEVAKEHAPGNRFLEVGCGIGSKLIMAWDTGLEVSGLDVHSQYINLARHLCPEAALLVADARDFEGYGSFDIVYCFKPIVSAAGQQALEQRIVEQMVNGAVLILPGGDIQAEGWEQLAADVWKCP